MGYAMVIIHNCKKFRMVRISSPPLGGSQQIESFNQRYCLAPGIEDHA